MDSVEEEAEGAPEPESFDVGDAEPVVAKGRDSWGLVGTDVQVPFQFWWPQDRSTSVQPCRVVAFIGRYAFGASPEPSYVILDTDEGHHYPIRASYLARIVPDEATRRRLAKKPPPKAL